MIFSHAPKLNKFSKRIQHFQKILRELHVTITLRSMQHAQVFILLAKLFVENRSSEITVGHPFL